MQAEGMKNRTSLHSVYDYDLKIRVSLSIGTRGQYKMGTKGLLCSGMSTKVALRYLGALFVPFHRTVVAPNLWRCGEMCLSSQQLTQSTRELNEQSKYHQAVGADE